jgi:transposase, IS5 family
MSERVHGQLSFADTLIERRSDLNKELDRLSGLIDWAALERLLEPLAPPVRGAPGYAPVVLFQAVLLAQWHGLSDERMEAALEDRLSFRRFCGFGAMDRVPDHTTLWRFREALGNAGLTDAAFAEITHQLGQRGLTVKKGTLIDASLIAAQAAVPPKPVAPAEPPAPGAVPPSLLVKSATDPDAGWTRRGKRRFFGYKAHIGVDQGSGLIRRQVLTGAEVNDTVIGDALIVGDERAVYADKAYDSRARRDALKAAHIKYRVQKRADKHHPVLSARDTRRNILIGRIRGRVETVWAFMKRVWGYRRVRYFNALRNKTQFALLCIAYNLRRALALTA